VHAWKCHNETHYFVQLIYTNNNNEKTHKDVSNSAGRVMGRGEVSEPGRHFRILPYFPCNLGLRINDRGASVCWAVKW
jgi:hypothetical protein